jgi:ADP-heptose:LPS heptosyltransferase
MNIQTLFLYFLSFLFCISLYMSFQRFERFKKKIETLKKTLDLAMSSIINNEINSPPLHDEIQVQLSKAIPHDEIKTILVVKLDHIGDVILTTPAFKSLREHFPSARIIALVSPWSKDVLKNNPDIDEILSFDFFPVTGRLTRLSKKKKVELKKLLSGYSFDLGIDFRKEPESREILLIANPRYTVGYEGHSLPFNLTLELSSIRRRIHRVEQFLDLVRILGAEPSDPEPALYPAREDRDFAADFLKQHGVQPQDTLIGVHPGARDENKRWFKERFIVLIDILRAEFPNAKIFLFGGPLEKQIISEMLQETDSSLIACDNFLGLLQFAAILEKMHVFIGNNSGPVHIAAAMKTPVVEIHSAFVDSREWSPYGKRNIVLKADLPCAPCHKTICRTLYYEDRKPVPIFCLRVIQPEDVLDAVKKILSGGR